MCLYNNTAILMTEKNYELLYEVKDICKTSNFNLIYEKDFYGLLQKVVRVNPKLIIIDEDCRFIKSFPFEILKNKVFEKEIKVVIVGNNFKCENTNVVVLPLHKLQDYIWGCEDFYLEEKRVFENCDKKINDLLFKMGFTPKLKGKDYLKDCIKLILEGAEQFSCLNKDCYPVIASNYKTHIINIDRNIRNAIQKAYGCSDKRIWEESLKSNFDRVPSSRSFIFMCVDKIKEEY